MYNLSNHYENIYQYLKTIIADPRVAYLYPFGSTQPENLEILRNDTNPPKIRGPMFIFYDQEPLNLVYNTPLFEYIMLHTSGPWVLISTERSSKEKERICDQFRFAHLDYFFHIFATADWYRGHEYLPGLISPQDRTLAKTYITFNRLTSNERVYRSLFVNELYKHNLLDQGHVSFSKICPDGGSFDSNLELSIANQGVDPLLVREAINNINQLPELRIDFADQDIPNQSMLLSPMDQLMESFVFVVTETCYWQDKTHLTEKIFKPIVLRMPFLLLGCAHNLEYLRSYGFRTFGDYWDESYDAIEDPILRMSRVVNILRDLSTMSPEQQKSMLMDMQPILDHNYNLFTDPNFIRREWDHLKAELKTMADSFTLPPPYTVNRVGQRTAIDPT
jgi:hypothetical protein